TAAARGRVVAEDGTAHIEVVARSEVAGFCLGSELHDPEVRLGVGTDGLRHGTMKRDPAAIGAEREIADSHGNGSQFSGRAASGTDRINLSARRLVIRLVNAA